MSTIEELITTQNIQAEDRAKIEKILGNFSAAGADRTQLSSIANSPDTLALEKKYVPSLNARSAIPLCDVLVCPVGFRPAPVLLITLILKPKQLYLVHSSESRRQAENVRDDPDIQLLGLDPDRHIHLRSVDLTSAPDSYDVIREVVQKHSHDQIMVDISGGIKVMGVSLAAAAFWQRLPVVYLFGEEVNGIIKPFTEQLTFLQNPYDHFGDSEFKLLKAFFDAHNYDAALNICILLRDTVGDVSTLGMLDILEEFVRLYRDWDAFVHSQSDDSADRKLATRLRVIIGKMDRLNVPLASKQQLQLNLDFLQKIEETWQANKRNLSDRYRLIDVFCAAQRRAKAGKYDEAVARLYRCLEMSATVALIEDWKIDNPRKPDFSELAKAVGGQKNLQQAFQKIARYELPTGALGLNDQMALLMVGRSSKHQSMCGIYMGMKNSDLMEHRNRSTLAHGTIPVPASVYEQFNKKTRDIISWIVGKDQVDHLIQQAMHPQLTLLRADAPQ